jgi:hypothetical protein
MKNENKFFDFSSRTGIAINSFLMMIQIFLLSICYISNGFDDNELSLIAL